MHFKTCSWKKKLQKLAKKLVWIKSFRKSLTALNTKLQKESASTNLSYLKKKLKALKKFVEKLTKSSKIIISQMANRMKILNFCLKFQYAIF